MSAKEVRLATILREMPYAVSFSQRVMVFSSLITREKMEHQDERSVNFMAGPSINIMVRRNYLYEDAFEKLSPENGERNNEKTGKPKTYFLQKPFFRLLEKLQNEK